MVAATIHDVAEIRLWQQTVGALDRQNGSYTFEYQPDWLKSGIVRSSLRVIGI